MRIVPIDISWLQLQAYHDYQYMLIIAKRYKRTKKASIAAKATVSLKNGGHTVNCTPGTMGILRLTWAHSFYGYARIFAMATGIKAVGILRLWAY